MVTLDFRMNTTCLYSRHRAADRDLVREERPQHHRHASLHPSAVRSGGSGVAEPQRLGDLQGFCQDLHEVCVGHLGVEKEMVSRRIMHDTAGEMAQPFDVKEWKKGECDPIPGKTMPLITVVERNYANIFKRFIALGPLDGQAGQRRQGHRLEYGTEVEQLGKLNGRVEEGVSSGHAEDRQRHRRLRGDPALAPETNGDVADKAWKRWPRKPASTTPSGAVPRRRQDHLPRHPGPAAQDHHLADLERHRVRNRVSYTSGYTNVHEHIPFRTLTGRRSSTRITRGCSPSAKASAATVRRWT